MENQVFISYRRKDGFYPAYLLYKELISKNYTVFFDIKSLRAGNFPSSILANIENCTDFILIVTESTFCERIFDEDDWIHKEISAAINNNKNIVPVFVNAEIPDKVPDDIAVIKSFNGIKQLDINLITQIYTKLCDEFLVSRPLPEFKRPAEKRCSVYDATYGDEFTRLSLQAKNSESTDKTVLDEIDAHGVVLDVGCAYGYVGSNRFADQKYTKVIGIDKNAAAIEQAKARSEEKFDYFVADVESADFVDTMTQYMQSHGINGFDVIFSSLVLHHLKEPYAALRKLRKLLSPSGYIVIRGSDDGTKIAYPDNNNLLNKILTKTLQVNGISDRLNGRKIFDWLTQSGFCNVKIHSFMRDTSHMDLDERDNLFRESFSYRINYFKKQLESDLSNTDYFAAFDEMEVLLAEFENEFMKEQFWYGEYDYVGVAQKR